MDQTITEYSVIAVKPEELYSSLVIDLQSRMQEFIQAGWQPYGPPYVYGEYVCQALVKYGDPQQKRLNHAR